MDRAPRHSAKPTVPQVLPMVREWFKSPPNSVFHCMLEDDNPGQSFADSALKSATQLGCARTIELAELLSAMSATQRHKIHVLIWL